MPMLHNTINAAEKNGALIVLPGTIYNYGPDAFPLLQEDSLQNPVTQKGPYECKWRSHYQPMRSEAERC
jgi:hypothetical protein